MHVVVVSVQNNDNFLRVNLKSASFTDFSRCNFLFVRYFVAHCHFMLTKFAVLCI
jgi:hypothetical protein